MRHYHSPWDVLDFQAMGVARLYRLHRRLVVWDTGLGKSHYAMAGAALLFEDDLICHTLVVAEQTKLDEWVDDFRHFTDLTVGLYHGQRRSRFLDAPPQVMITTYETARNDASHKEVYGARHQTRRVEGSLTLALVAAMQETGKGVLVVYDEASKFRNRTSETYKSHDLLVKRLEKPGREKVWIAGLTATPIETRPENGFNEWRLFDRTYAPTVERFAKAHILYTDDNGKSIYKNIGEGDRMRIPGEPLLADEMAYLIDRKRKSDPDVKDRFPRMVEDISPTSMTPDQKAIYEEVERILEDHASDLSLPEQGAMFMSLRQLVGHPEALLYSNAEGSQRLVEHFGVERLVKAGSGKLERLVAYLRPILEQGDQGVVYSFFGRSIIPLIAKRFEDEGISFITHTGTQTKKQKSDARSAFRAGEHQILLSSDAGSKGINLPEATYVVNYELPPTHATYVQRINRASRLSEGISTGLVTAKSFVVPHTVEASIAGVVYQRNEWHDMVVDADGNLDPDHIKASDRIVLRMIADAPRP